MLGRDEGFVLLPVPKERDTQIQALEDKINALKARMTEQSTALTILDGNYQSRRSPLVESIDSLAANIRHCEEEAATLTCSVEDERPPGPPWLSWIESWQSNLICNAIILANLFVMLIHSYVSGQVSYVISSLILLCLLVELVLKIIYHQHNFFIGPLAVVWWSWLDVAIVCGGMWELWVLPFLELSQHHALSFNLGLLRLLRVLRLLKALKVLFHLEPSIVITREFDFFMNCVIFFNAIVMGWSSDVKWGGWYWVDQTFLLFYVVELIARAKYLRWAFFTDPEIRSWNYLDLTIVCAGVFDQWLVPMLELTSRCISGETSIAISGPGNVTQMLRFMRLFRVLRLAKLLKSIPPLQRLLLGVMKALGTMKWVLALTALVLYSAAIVFTNLVTKGIIEDSGGAGLENFGSVESSLFSLFKLMNGDTEIADCLTELFVGKVLFVGFMVLSNWTLLGIMTAVVSDNMIRSSLEVAEIEKETQEELEQGVIHAKISSMFVEFDSDHDGFLEEHEWLKLLEDPGLRSVLSLSDASPWREHHLQSLFECLAEESCNEEGEIKRCVSFEELMGAMRANSERVDYTAMMKMTAQLNRIERICQSQQQQYQARPRSHSRSMAPARTA